jgi:hypothetical protein
MHLKKAGVPRYQYQKMEKKVEGYNLNVEKLGLFLKTTFIKYK